MEESNSDNEFYANVKDTRELRNVLYGFEKESWAHLLFTPDFYFGHNMKNLTWADWNCELAFYFTMPKT